MFCFSLILDPDCLELVLKCYAAIRTINDDSISAAGLLSASSESVGKATLPLSASHRRSLLMMEIVVRLSTSEQSGNIAAFVLLSSEMFEWQPYTKGSPGVLVIFTLSITPLMPQTDVSTCRRGVADTPTALLVHSQPAKEKRLDSIRSSISFFFCLKHKVCLVQQ